MMLNTYYKWGRHVAFHVFRFSWLYALGMIFFFPIAWKSQFTRGDHGKPTIMLKAIASQYLWIWHVFFGVTSANNDINVLNQSHLFNENFQGEPSVVQYIMNETQYNMRYYLANWIYP